MRSSSAALPPGSTITLSWGDFGNPDTNNPTIDLFQAADPDGGLAYLTNQSVASLQVNPLYVHHIATLGPGQRIQLNSSRFAGGWAGDYYIWCGVAAGTGSLTLAISDSNNNVLAQSSQFVQLQDIKEMYERWTVGDEPAETPSTSAQLAGDGVPRPFQYGPSADTNTPYILYIHGWNMEQWDKNRFAESAFKRLYWQGYQGRFGLFRWPTGYGFVVSANAIAASAENLLFFRRNFDNSEFNAWQSAVGLENLLNNLNQEYPGRVYLLAHSMGNIVAGQALRFAGSQQVNTYVASQAAVTAHVYDGTVTNSIFVRGSPRTPNVYSNWFAANSGGVGRRINFYNLNDYALQNGRWGYNQISKPDDASATLSWAYAFYGYPYNVNGQPIYTPGSADDNFPWLYFAKFKLGQTVYFDLTGPEIAQFEVMSYAAQSRATALGRTSVITNMVNFDLTTAWPPDPTGQLYTEHFWHSAEFRGDCWQQQAYWNTLLLSRTQGFGITNR